MSVFARLGVRIIRATLLVDGSQRLFDQMRSAVVARFATAGLLAAYNDVAYGMSANYIAGSPVFRARLFHWEEEVTARVFPPPPARLLVGGAGGGREALAWAQEGYEIVAFEPSLPLASSMVTAAAGRAITPLVGRYEDLPALNRVESSTKVDVTGLGPFGATVFGWTSYSHIRTREGRLTALGRMAALTDGPVVLSFYARSSKQMDSGSIVRRVGRAIGFRQTGDAFSPYVGFYHWSTREEIEQEIAEAGLEIVASSYDDNDGRWPWIAARRVRAANAVSP
jgi:hypothetical protein